MTAARARRDRAGRPAAHRLVYPPSTTNSEPVEAQRLSGEPDHLIRMVSADLASCRRLHEPVLIHLPGVRSLDPAIVTKQAVPPRPLPERPPSEVPPPASLT
ncbi:Lrp/AsnC ligand binding domain-containing protein [Streptomyces sp. NPDC006367]|uniref:Lrp/AsnC ligand binding domain-containing protein n=1 Tax=unclassified Streptomyces TaxID=2593676 RepID=UPI0033A50A9D